MKWLSRWPTLLSLVEFPCWIFSFLYLQEPAFWERSSALLTPWDNILRVALNWPQSATFDFGIFFSFPGLSSSMYLRSNSVVYFISSSLQARLAYVTIKRFHKSKCCQMNNCSSLFQVTPLTGGPESFFFCRAHWLFCQSKIEAARVSLKSRATRCARSLIFRRS